MRTKWAVFLIFCAYVMTLAALALPGRAEDEKVRLPIIMYHHVCADPARAGDYVVTPETFENDLKYLQEQGYTAISVAELLTWSRGEGELPEKPVMLTFDDAQDSFRVYALPLLEKYGMCAVVAVVGNYADEYTESGDTNVNYAYMSWDTIGEIAASGQVEIASHTQSMHSPSGARRGCQINPGEDEASYTQTFGADLESVESSIVRATGKSSVAFAYPFGFTCAEAERVLVSHGFSVAFTCTERVNVLSHEPMELLRLGRFNRRSGPSSAEFFGAVL